MTADGGAPSPLKGELCEEDCRVGSLVEGPQTVKIFTRCAGLDTSDMVDCGIPADCPDDCLIGITAFCGERRDDGARYCDVTQPEPDGEPNVAD